MAVIVIVMLGPAAAQSSQSWAWCVNQGSTFSADQQINGCSSIIQSGRERPRNLSVGYYSRGLAYYDKATTTAQSPSSTKRSGSIRNLPPPIPAAALGTTTRQAPDQSPAARAAQRRLAGLARLVAGQAGNTLLHKALLSAPAAAALQHSDSPAPHRT